MTESPAEPSPDHEEPRQLPASRDDERGTGPSSSGEASIGLPMALRFFAAVVAPTTLVTALLVYFGRLYTVGQTGYLHVESTIFNFSVQDYLARAAAGLYVPLVAVVGCAAVTLWAWRLLLHVLAPDARARVARVAAPVVGSLGVLPLIVATVALFQIAPRTWPPELGGLCLSVGVVMIEAGFTLLRLSGERTRSSALAPSAVAEWAVVFLLFGAGLFWAVGDYANDAGTSWARQTERDLASSPDVVLYSTTDLGVELPGVTQTLCTTPAGPESTSAFRFRYEGLKLVLQSGGYYLFLPDGWTSTHGTAVVVPQSGLRLEFSPPASGRRGRC
ncbi:hypothetical protein LQ327_22640 [Actinomycetospora endophytica]|uniref:Uncharacterized protein n=1 Tax=Actinomycetospora endophytica TaxID=2291215 RepID=A0ABS8PF84_9PSEU|nr:hypothetical protein [Actinomycetospora endophytica]MCD2196175.1 hypothetical protein [Actinomycetospora endophytica]